MSLESCCKLKLKMSLENCLNLKWAMKIVLNLKRALKIVLSLKWAVKIVLKLKWTYFLDTYGCVKRIDCYCWHCCPDKLFWCPYCVHADNREHIIGKWRYNWLCLDACIPKRWYSECQCVWERTTLPGGGLLTFSLCQIAKCQFANSAILLCVLRKRGHGCALKHLCQWLMLCTTHINTDACLYRHSHACAC